MFLMCWRSDVAQQKLLGALARDRGRTALVWPIIALAGAGSVQPSGI